MAAAAAAAAAAAEAADLSPLFPLWSAAEAGFEAKGGIGGEALAMARSRSSAKALSKGEMSIIWPLVEWDEVVEAELSGEVEGGCMELRLFKEVANMACCSNMAFERQPLQKGTWEHYVAFDLGTFDE